MCHNYLRYLPNVLTFLRMVLTVPITLAIVNDRSLVALELFLLAGFCDFLDGFLARRYNWQSGIGAWLDPVADKLLLVTVFIALAYRDYIPGWLVALIIFRDFVIISGALAFRYAVGRYQLKPSLLGKMTTFSQICLVAWVMFCGSSAGVIAGTMVSLATCLLIASGVHYMIVWGRYYLETKK